ncbi:Peptidase inhibitor 16 [Bulinus truncatus]|nr:Peptidase inhibitor 16 [Bulinus truncatus]
MCHSKEVIINDGRVDVDATAVTLRLRQIVFTDCSSPSYLKYNEKQETFELNGDRKKQRKSVDINSVNLIMENKQNLALSIVISLSCVIRCHAQTVNTQISDDIYRRPGHFPLSNSANKTSFTLEEKQLIVNLHNAYRSMVIPEATNMRELEWDNDLEEFARNHTQACTGAHSHRSMVKKWGPRPNTWQSWNSMGEVLYYRYGTWYSINEAMWMWWAEGKDYDISSLTCVPGRVCGHYQVMTNAANARVGCALNVCQQFSVSRYPTPATFIACVYDASYYSDARPYNVGRACSDCTKQKQGYHFQYCRHKLCIGPHQKFRHSGFNGDTHVTGL